MSVCWVEGDYLVLERVLDDRWMCFLVDADLRECDSDKEMKQAQAEGDQFKIGIIQLAQKIQAVIERRWGKRISSAEEAKGNAEIKAAGSDLVEMLHCPVTLEPMRNAVRLIPCGHRLDKHVAIQLLDAKKGCPTCTRPFTGNTSDSWTKWIVYFAKVSHMIPVEPGDNFPRSSIEVLAKKRAVAVLIGAANRDLCTIPHPPPFYASVKRPGSQEWYTSAHARGWIEGWDKNQVLCRCTVDRMARVACPIL